MQLVTFLPNSVQQLCCMWQIDDTDQDDAAMMTALHTRVQVLEELLGAGVPSEHRLTEQADEADGAASCHPSSGGTGPALLERGAATLRLGGCLSWQPRDGMLGGRLLASRHLTLTRLGWHHGRRVPDAVHDGRAAASRREGTGS